jgi:hypothetical protein
MSPIVVPTGATPTISDLTACIRLDLFDAGQRAGDDQRWWDVDLIRAPDRANEKYSTVAPYLKEALIPTAPFMASIRSRRTRGGSTRPSFRTVSGRNSGSRWLRRYQYWWQTLRQGAA